MEEKKNWEGKYFVSGGEGKGGKYLERANIWSAEEKKKGEGKREKYFENETNIYGGKEK